MHASRRTFPAVQAVSFPHSNAGSACRCGVFHVLSQYNSVRKTSKGRPGLGQCPSHMETPKSAPPSSFLELKWRESIFHTSYPFLESYGQEAPQPTTLLPMVAGGKNRVRNTILCHSELNRPLCPVRTMSTQISCR